MTVEVQDGLFTHSSGNRMSTIRVTEDGGVSVRVKNSATGLVHPDEYNYAERIALARLLLQGVVWGPNFRVEDFANGYGGPNGREDRRAYVDSFGPLLGKSGSASAIDLQTWIDHDDSSRLDGEWDERVRSYYRDRGYPGPPRL